MDLDADHIVSQGSFKGDASGPCSHHGIHCDGLRGMEG